MRFDFLSPQLFDMLIYANLALGALLIIGRFTMDMRRKPPVREQREQIYDESSYSHLSDTDANPALARETNDDQNKNSQRSKP
jgi:hypothetical protein